MEFYERVESLRKKTGLGQGKTEKEMGVANGSINKWKCRNPKIETMEKAAKYFDVSVEFLKGETNETICNECGYSYNPLDDFDCACHENIHHKILEAQSRFTFLIPYKETSKMIASSLAEIRNDSEKFWDSIGNYLKAEFSNYIYLNYDSEDNYDYDEFCKSTILSMIQNGDIPVSKVDALMECYKIDKERVDDDSAMFARIIKNPQMMRMLKYLEKLEPNTFNVIYKQVKALYEQDDQE